MRAVVCKEYGLPDAFQIEEAQKPVPKDHEVLVRVYATSVTVHNLGRVRGKPFFVRLMGTGLLRPKIKAPGSDMAGRIEAVGKSVKLFKPRDEVYGDLSACGFGALAEYVSVPADSLGHKPTNMSFEEAAAVPQTALVALQGLHDKGHIEAGQNVLIYGACGGIGTFAVQIAKYFGAEVTGVCSTRNVELIQSLGAVHVIDYTAEDFTKGTRGYDLIFATAYRSILDCMRALSPKGTYVSTGGSSLERIFQDMVLGPLMSRNEGRKVVAGWALVVNKDLGFVTGLIEAGKVRSVTDKRYPLDKAAKAFRYFENGHARGKVIITE